VSKRRWPKGYKPKDERFRMRIDRRLKRKMALRAAARGYSSMSAYIRALVEADCR
jgi:hypothetical protein